ncbi:MAG: glycoside hydrolase family 3 C-terminal domain-containing protein [bacterium]|nr:glycoside hydrolase family 3 C-terminal domain-containing protein [bacterium]
MKTRMVVFLAGLLISSSLIAQNKKSLSTPEIEAQIEADLAKMSVEEKVGQTCQITLDVLLKKDAEGKLIEPVEIDPAKVQEAIVEYGVGSVLNVGWKTLSLEEWEGVMEGVHAPYQSKDAKAPILYGIDAIHGVNYTVGGTLFPQEIGLAATWNPRLAMQFGQATAYETRASGIHWNFSPVLDLGRQPLWSRTFETLGEDPLLVSEMGKAIVCGYQGKGGINSEHVAACMKHFVGYSHPSSGRDRTPAWIPEKYMQELYLPPFKAAVEAGALTVMINSGVVNGIPGHENYELLTETLKNEWGFEGFAVSDWEDFIMLHTVHRTAATLKEGIINAINAGVDMSMVPLAPQYQEYCKLMIEAVNEGSITPDRLDDAVRRILRVKYIVGLYEKRMNQAKKYVDFGSEKMHQLALESALESITLLENDGVLPLKKSQKVLVTGPTSNNLIFLNGAWTHTWQGDNPLFNTKGRFSVREAIEAYVGTENVLFSQGAEVYMDEGFEASKLSDTEDFISKAEESDVILLCLGEFPSTEKPGDIRSLNLDSAQIELAKMAYATGKPVVLVMIEGRPRIIREIVDDASAIVQAYLPGDFGGEALAQLIYGEENFSGKLPYTYQKYDGQIEFYDHPRSVARHKANHFDAFDPQWEFGYGLSYTTFEYSNLTLDKNTLTEGDSIVITVDVTNTGSREGKEVVQLYISDHFASMTPAVKSLNAFEKVTLGAKDKKTVKFVLATEDLQFYGRDDEWICEPGMFSATIETLSADFELK